jgi:hypothetical protein
MANLGGTNVPMSRYILSITFNPNAPPKPAASPAPGRKRQKNDESS